MSIRKYIAYLRTVETGSITQAANELGYTQSAVSKMISDLEQDWQVKLLTRNHSGIEISSDGMVLLPTIREIVKDYEDLNFAVSELHGVQSGTLRLGCFTSLAISLLPEILKDFHQTYPNIQIQLMTGEYYEISEWLRRGAIDCGYPCKRYKSYAQRCGYGSDHDCTAGIWRSEVYGRMYGKDQGST